MKKTMKMMIGFAAMLCATSVMAVDVSSASALSSAISNAGSSATTIRLTANITTSELTISSGKNITLDLNGHSLVDNSTGNSVVLKVTGGTLTIKDGTSTSTKNGNGYISGGENSYSGTRMQGGAIYQSGGTINFESGSIKDTKINCSGSYGAGVFIAGGTFNMSGTATFSNCVVHNTMSGGGEAKGAAIHLEDGTLTMSGNALITNCHTTQTRDGSHRAGGVMQFGGTFTMSGGTITNCSTERGYGAAIAVERSGVFTMTGGLISDCKTLPKSDNSDSGGGVLANSTANFLGGTIRNCSTTYGGGGIQVLSKNVTIAGDMVVTGCKSANRAVDNVNINDDSTTIKIDSGGMGANANVGIHFYSGKLGKFATSAKSSDCSGFTPDISNQYVLFNDNGTGGSASDDYLEFSNVVPVVFTLDRQGGTGGSASVSAIRGEVMPAVTPPTKAGYTFQGYYTATSGGTQYYTSAGTTTRVCSESTGITLYAHWTANTYTVTFDKNNANAGNPSPASKSVTYDSTYGTLATCSRTGYTFAGWYTAASGGTKIEASTKVAITANQTLYAHWTANTYAVTFKANGGTGGATSLTATYDAAMPSAAVPARTGYTFAGYFDAQTGGTQYYNANGTSAKNWDKAAAATLYAQWTANTYTVSLNQNGGSGGTTSVKATYDAAMPQVAVPGRTGYTFAGYFDAATGGTKYYNADGTGARNWDKTANTTLYAQWTGNAYVVTLPDGTKVDVTYGQRSVDVPPATKPGYTFNGYGDANGTKYYNANGTPTGETWATASDVTLVPLFTANTYTITLDAQGGEGGTPSVTATYDAALPKVEVPEKTGHTFLGYFDAEEGGKQYYDDAGNSMSSWDKEGDTVLFAQWSVKTFMLTFDQQGGEGGTEFALVDYLAALPKVRIPALTGHTFLGYFDGTDAEAVKYYESNGGSTNVYEWLENKTLYARWKANTYKYVLDGGAFTGELAVVYGRVPSNIRVPQDEENVFMGYFDADGNMVYGADGKYVGDAAGYLVAGNTNLKAKWTEKAEVIAMVGAPKQRWPWNGKYDIAYTAESLKAQRSYVVNVEMTVTEPDAAEPKTVTTLVQIPSENGEHTLMADFSGLVAAETLDANAAVRLRLFLSDKEGEKVEE